MSNRTHTKIRELNDSFRKGSGEGQLMVTQGVAQRHDVWEIVQQVRTYNSFDSENDPYNEADFGSIEINGQTIFWKIDYYDKDLASGSPDPADPTVTTRVLTVMLAEEY